MNLWLHGLFGRNRIPTENSKYSVIRKQKYNLILSLHHYGYDDSTLAIGAFLEFIDSAESDFKYKISRIRRGQENMYVTIPLEIRPLTISVELDIEDLKPSINQFVQDSLTVTLAHLSNQI